MSARRRPIDTPAFASEVMRAVDRMPRPTPAQAFAQALGDRSATDAISALWVAWHLATARGWSPAPAARVRSLALVVGVVMAMGGGSLVAARTVQVVADAAIQGIAALQGADRDDSHAGASDEQAGSEDRGTKDDAASASGAGLAPSGPDDRAADDHSGGTAEDPDEAANPDDAGAATEPGADTEQPRDEDSHPGAGAADGDGQPDTDDHSGAGSGGASSDPDDPASKSGSHDGATEPPANDGGDAAPDGSSDGGD